MVFPKFIKKYQFRSVQSLSRVQLFVTPWTVPHQVPPSMGILQARILEWIAMPFSRGRRHRCISSVQFSSVQSLSRVQLFVIPWTTAHQASLSSTNSRSSLKLMSIESVMPSSHLILCSPLLLLPPIPPSIRVFSSESTLHMRLPKYWSFSFSISPSNEHPGLIPFRMD